MDERHGTLRTALALGAIVAGLLLLQRVVLPWLGVPT